MNINFQEEKPQAKASVTLFRCFYSNAPIYLGIETMRKKHALIVYLQMGRTELA